MRIKRTIFIMSKRLLRILSILGSYALDGCFRSMVATAAPVCSTAIILYWSTGISSIILDVLFFVSLLVICFVLFLDAQDMLLYYPNQPSDARIIVPSPREYGVPYDNLTITTSDGTNLHAFLLKHSDSVNRPTMIMFHGNAGNIGHRVPNAYQLSIECGINVLLLEYRGYGRSGGFVSESGLYDDAESAISFVKSRTDLNPNLIVLHGRSLGGAVAIHAACQSQHGDVFAVILENTFTNLPAIAKRVVNLSIIKSIPMWCYNNKYPSLERIATVRQPTLFLSGRADTLVPPQMMDELARASGSKRKELVCFPNGTHNETWAEPGYTNAINRFLSSLR